MFLRRPVLAECVIAEKMGFIFVFIQHNGSKKK